MTPSNGHHALPLLFLPLTRIINESRSMRCPSRGITDMTTPAPAVEKSVACRRRRGRWTMDDGDRESRARFAFTNGEMMPGGLDDITQPPCNALLRDTCPSVQEQNIGGRFDALEVIKDVKDTKRNLPVSFACQRFERVRRHERYDRSHGQIQLAVLATHALRQLPEQGAPGSL